MFLSVVIPVYNTKEYLENCVRSVLEGDCRDCEIILVDDGATDGVCPALCDRIARENPGLVRVIHQENRGLGGARNTGLEAARGEYVYFLDSDDTIMPEFFSVIRDTAERYHPQVISFPMYSDNGQGKLTFVQTNAVTREEPFAPAQYPELLLSLPSACCRVWARELFVRSGVRYPGRVWYEDLRTTPKLFALAASVVTLKEPLYRYLQRPGSIMRSENLGRNREIIDAFQDLLSWYGEQGLLDVYRPMLERLCVDHLYLAASVRVAMSDPRHPLLGELRDYLRENFPDYGENPWVAGLKPLHKVALRLLEGKHYRLLGWLFRLRAGMS